MFPVKAQFAVRQIKGDFILHDPRTDTVHRLNPVAAIIWQLCDGTRDRSAIFAEIADIFGKSPSDVAGDVDEMLARFIDAGLVHSSAALPEIDLLLRCVRTAIGNERPCGIRTQLSNNIDWIFIEQTAVQHGVLPLVYRGLREIQQNDVPSGVLERLEHSVNVNAERNRFLFQELLGLLALFEANDTVTRPRDLGHWRSWALLLPLCSALIRGVVPPIVKLGLAVWPSALWACLIGYVTSSLVVLTVQRVRKGSFVVQAPRAGLFWFAMTGISNGLSALTLFAAVRNGPITLVAPLAAIYPLVTVGLSAMVLKHIEITARIVAGAALTVLGVVLVLIG